MGIGAVFGAINTMYTAVASAHARDRDAARARLRREPGRVSVLAESLAAGARRRRASAARVAYVAFNGYQTSTMNCQTFSQVAFAFAVTPALLAQGVVYAVLMGLVGGLFPAIRAARLPIVTALREL